MGGAALHPRVPPLFLRERGRTCDTQGNLYFVTEQSKALIVEIFVVGQGQSLNNHYKC